MKLVCVVGPTGCGKTWLGVELAKMLGGEVVSCDSMQIYRGMAIGTAAPTAEEMQGVPHHLIDVLEPEEDFHVVLFQKLAKAAMEDIWSRGHIPILTGGTGFYIQALLYDIDFTEQECDSAYRRQLEELAETRGNHYLHEMLKAVDTASAEAIHENNRKRVIRALEFYHESGERISEHNERESQKTSPYNFAYFVLNDNPRYATREIFSSRRRHTRYRRDWSSDVCSSDLSMQGLGYKEILAYLNGTSTLEEAIYIIKRESRHFAKRQLTWFHRERDVIWLNKPDFEYDDTKILTYMMDVLQAKGILPA